MCSTTYRVNLCIVKGACQALLDQMRLFSIKKVLMMFSSSWVQHKGNLWLPTAVWPVKFLSVLLLPIFFVWALPNPAQAGDHWHSHHQAPPTYLKYLPALSEPVWSGLGCWWFLFTACCSLWIEHCTPTWNPPVHNSCCRQSTPAWHASSPFPGCLAFLNSYFSCFQIQSSVITHFLCTSEQAA